MSKLTGATVTLTYDRTDRFDWTDPKTGQLKPIQKFVGLMEAGDGTRTWAEIGFPRDPGYRAPSLKPGTAYVFPVILGVDKKRGEVRLTIRTDIEPFEAPELG